MCDFVYLMDYFPHDIWRTSFLNKIKSIWKGYYKEQNLEFQIPKGPIIKGKIIFGSNLKQDIIQKLYNPKVVGSEEDKINLNLAVLIHNLKRRFNSEFENKTKPNITLYNIFNDSDEMLAETLTFVLDGHIILSGENSIQLKIISDKLFRDFGVMTSVVEQPSQDSQGIKLDVSSLRRYEGNMNFIGKYSASEKLSKKNYVFPAKLIETVLLAGELVDTIKYKDTQISKQNIFLIANIAKKHGFIPLFSDIEND